VEPTNDQDPNYYHKVVDCQWACPAHTNVPGYIRMIAQGDFDDAYMLNRESNVFPGILGRTCDRPCEPACRRDRVTGNPSPSVDSARRLGPEGRYLGPTPVFRPRRTANGLPASARSVVADGRQRLAATRLRGRDVRAVRQARWIDALEHPVVPSTRSRTRRRDAGHSRHGRRDSLQHADHEHEALLADGFDSVFVGVGAPRARSWTSPVVTTKSNRTSSSASTGSNRWPSSHQFDRLEGADHRCR